MHYHDMSCRIACYVSNLLYRGANAEMSWMEDGQNKDSSHLFKVPDFLALLSSLPLAFLPHSTATFSFNLFCCWSSRSGRVSVYYWYFTFWPWNVTGPNICLNDDFGVFVKILDF